MFIIMTNFWFARRKYEITMWALPIVPFGSSGFIADFLNSIYVYTFIVQISNQFLKHIFVSNEPFIEISWKSAYSKYKP